MSISKEELGLEKQYLKEVKEVIQEIINSSKLRIDKRKLQINEQKKFMWDNISDFTDEERAIALSEVDNDVNLINRNINNISSLEKAFNSPYFAKIDFKDEIDDENMSIYIGIKSINKNLVFYVFDWRAPISSLFYNYELGKAKYDTPTGECTGEILSKMQFKIENGEILRCFKSDINIDDEYLQEILSSSSTEKMKNIVDTIQREQNEIIRNIKDKYLIVQGVAGSGKTSVALHRIAYLLYRNINLTSNNILILSPSDVFSEYISNVLPELGEDNVLKTTFSEFAQSFLKPYKHIESYTLFLERTYNDDNENKKIVNYKMSFQYYEDIHNFIEDYKKNLKFTSGISGFGKTYSKELLTKILVEKYSIYPLKERIEAISEYICSQFKQNKKQIKNTIKKKIADLCDIEINFVQLYNIFLNSSYCKEKSNNIETKIFYEDIMGLLYLYFEINGYPNYGNIKHVVIDEAQDYTKFQIEILKKIFKNASFTILGDENQIINPYCMHQKLRNFQDVFINSRYIELNKTYRSSEEIINYTNNILNINNVCSVRKNNNIPVCIKDVSDEKIIYNIEDDMEKMKAMGIHRIAIITKNLREAIDIYNKIKRENGDAEVQLISSSRDKIKSSNVVIPSYLSKGLEFEGVIICNNTDNNYDESETNLYYVVCTRAQHKLNIYNEPSKILKRKK